MMPNKMTTEEVVELIEVKGGLGYFLQEYFSGIELEDDGLQYLMQQARFYLNEIESYLGDYHA